MSQACGLASAAVHGMTATAATVAAVAAVAAWQRWPPWSVIVSVVAAAATVMSAVPFTPPETLALIVAVGLLPCRSGMTCSGGRGIKARGDSSGCGGGDRDDGPGGKGRDASSCGGVHSLWRRSWS